MITKMVLGKKPQNGGQSQYCQFQEKCVDFFHGLHFTMKLGPVDITDKRLSICGNCNSDNETLFPVSENR